MYLSRVALVLGRLAHLDPGGRLQNRPINSLRAIFLFWHPNTTATLVQRMQVLDLLIAREPNVAWELLSKIMPQSFDHGSETPRPQWRLTVIPPAITYAELNQAVTQILERALSLAGRDADRLVFLVPKCGNWPQLMRERLIVNLAAFADASANPGDGAAVWAALREFINIHRAHPTAEWALPAAALPPFEVLRDRLIPADLYARYAWLFDDWWPNLGDPRQDDHVAIEASIARARQDAIRHVLQESGQGGLVQLARMVEYPGFVGRDAAEVISNIDEQRALLLATLAGATTADQLLGQTLVATWYQLAGTPWINTMLAPPITLKTAVARRFVA
jgi:hypothetical protein